MRLRLSFLSTIALTLTACASTNYTPTKSTEVIALIAASERAPLVCESKNNSSVLLATIIGGAIGNQFGSGSGRKAMTAVGAIAGGASAANKNKRNQHDQDCRSDGWINRITYVNPYTNMVEQTTIKTKYSQKVGSRIRTTINIPVPPRETK